MWFWYVLGTGNSISTQEVFGHNIIEVGNMFFLCRVLF